MEVFALDFQNNRVGTGIDSSDVKFVDVEVVTGDEILTIVKNDETVVRIDSCPYGRIMNFYDGSYTVSSEDLEDWLKRRTSYDY